MPNNKYAIFVILYLFSVADLPAQSGAAVQDRIRDFPVPNMLNYSKGSSSFHELNDKLFVVDFFGTWCVPCLKALPKLSALQDKFKNDIRIMLVSEESQSKLESFIKKQKEFSLPVIVDAQKDFVRRFNPPSYPYTVIIGKGGNVLALPSQEEVTEENIAKWLKMEGSDVAINKSNTDVQSEEVSEKNKQMSLEVSPNILVQLSQEFMYAAKTGGDASVYIRQLQNIKFADLLSTISTDNEKKAFWINLYNGFTQVALKNNPDQYKSRGKFFSAGQIQIAGHQFSLDDIEHGILRRSKIKWSLGYLNKLFAGKTEKKLRVDKLDYRLHFALNCGARSCPPIAFYQPKTISQQLDMATRAYLSDEAEYDQNANVVKLPKLMSWFRRDFGGKKKMISLLKQLLIIPVDANPKIKFKEYDWTLYLQNYKS